ncbi:MAG TPA: hypothetical protein VNY05_29180 [Candidatus Acidoferrales bacterium]|jgi:hypothetical protein|nr:hypothetical protein [Candidatus Acidoferrales bacterium]
MIYRNPDGRYPSLLVEDGQTLTISARDAREIGVPMLTMQPRTTAALLVLAGQPPPAAPRLSDRAAFEQIDRTEGLASFSKLDQDGRIAGYSVSFIRGVLEAFDPNDRVPPQSVKRLIPSDVDKPCDCSSSQHQARNVTRATNIAPATSAVAADVSQSKPATGSLRAIRVPEFLVDFKVYSLFVRLGDIVVSHNATLVLDSDISFAIADNVLAYTGARIVQRGGNMNLDVTGIMRGSIFSLIHSVTDVLRVNFQSLAAELATKP